MTAPGPSAPLYVAGCSLEAARFACERWHYLKKLPSFKTRRYGVWEHGRFRGALVFSHPLPHIRKTFGVEKMRIVELARVALYDHEAPVSQIVAVTIRLLSRANPLIRLFVSYADSGQGHHGGIYQAGGWHYTGLRETMPSWWIGSRRVHDRIHGQMRVDKLDTSHMVSKPEAPKHRYILFGPAVTSLQREKVLDVVEPYPKPTKQRSAASAYQVEEGGANPTRGLQAKRGRGPHCPLPAYRPVVERRSVSILTDRNGRSSWANVPIV